MFQVGEKSYVLKYTMRSIERIEAALGKSLMKLFAVDSFMPKISELKVLIGYALQEEGGERFVNYADGLKIADELISQNGIVELIQLVATRMMEDCDFLFRAN